jgi:ribonuclease VapC
VGVAGVIVIDTSAVIAILNEEPEKQQFVDAIARDGIPVISAVSVYEAMIVMINKSDGAGALDVESFLTAAKVEIMPFDLAQAKTAQQAYLKYGKGFNPASRLNLCDCAAFALAQTLSAPLLYKGEDFKATPVAAAA